MRRQARGERRKPRGGALVLLTVCRCGWRRVAAVALVALLGAALAGPAAAETVRVDADTAARRVVEVSDAATAAAARSDGARATVKGADAALYPTVAATASVAQRSAVPELSAQLNGPLEPPVVLYPNIETTYATAVQAHQVLYAGGAVTAGRAASRDDLDAIEASRRQVTADLALAGRLAYWEAVRADASQEAAVSNQQRAQRLLDDTRALRDAGMAVVADVLAAESRLASAHVAVIQAQTRRADAFARLRSLLHYTAGDAIVLADKAAGALPPPPEALDALTAEALAHRPEIAALTARLAALAAREQIARAQSKPALSLGAQWELSRPNQRYFPLTDSWNDSWSVGVSGSWTVFDGGKASADTRAAEAEQRAVAAQRSDLERAVALDVEQTRQELQAALATAVATQAALAAATEHERASHERLEAGLAPMVEILDAQAELAAAEKQQIDAQAAAWIAAASLQRTLGR